MTSKKYQYKQLSLSTAVHSLKVTFKVLTRRPEALLVLILMFAIDGTSSLLYFASPLVLIYAYCKSGVIEERFNEKWKSYKSFLLMAITLCTIIFLLLNLLVEPSVSQHSEPSSLLFILFVKVIVYTLVTAFNVYISITMILHSGEVYDEYRGENQLKIELMRDRKMLALILIAAMTMNYLVLILLYSIIICHIYTPDMPKKKEVMVTSIA